MPSSITTNKVKRIIDANINRLKEGLRVCEEICRFMLDSRDLTREFKKIRHATDPVFKTVYPYPELIRHRASETDAGRNIQLNELERKNPQDIFFANMQRIKESLRVLEEFSKLTDKKSALKFKKIRYLAYGTEKKAAAAIASLSDSG